MVGASEAIEREVLTWPGVTSGPHRFGGMEFHLGRRELGHLHGDREADFPFTRARRDELIAAGRVQQHRWLPESGWATRRIVSQEDVTDVIALLHEQYDRAIATQLRRAHTTP